MIKLTPTREEIDALRARLAPGPVVIVNLLKFKPGDGRAAYLRYMHEASRCAYAGTEILYAGAAAGDVGGGEDWDFVIIARYPHYDAFAAVVTDTIYQVDAHAHRPAALEKTIMLVTQPADMARYFADA
ncbi:MAG: hypothetical protein AB7Q97_11670 [Gammaproteobacteria bacterium]